MASVKFLIDFQKKVVSLSGLTSNPIQKNIILNLKEPKHIKKMVYLEHMLDVKSKWVFSWEHWNGQEQFFKIEQYMPFPSPRPVPKGYKPWTQIASWSYLSNPSIGTMQKDTIYRNYYCKDQMPEIKDIVFKTIGSPGGDWETTEATDGYWY